MIEAIVSDGILVKIHFSALVTKMLLDTKQDGGLRLDLESRAVNLAILRYWTVGSV